MFNDLEEESFAREIREKNRQKMMRKRSTESAKLKNYDTRQTPVQILDTMARKRPMTGMINSSKRVSRSRTLSNNGQG